MEQRQQELKPALPKWEQFLFDFKAKGLLETVNPEIVNDPSYQKIQDIAKTVFPAVDPRDPLNQIQTAAAKDPRIAGVIAAAKALKKRKAPAIIKKDEAEQLAKKLNKSELYHGSPTTGIMGALKIPKAKVDERAGDITRGSSGGIYTTTGLLDPRLMLYAKKRNQELPGSVYGVKPKFERTYDAQNVDPEIRKYLESKVTRKTYNPDDMNRQTAVGIEQLLDINSKAKRGLGYPTYMAKDFADVFREISEFRPNLKNYDSLYFGPRNRMSRKTTGNYDESNTVISLKDLDIQREIPYEEMIELFEKSGKYYPGKY
tara:strand:+ start:522 stop:1469 length:948 start_codon:yes stop_codon:yes gene_type:complete